MDKKRSPRQKKTLSLLYFCLGALVVVVGQRAYEKLSAPKEENKKNPLGEKPSKPQPILRESIQGSLEKQQGAPQFKPEEFSPEGFNWTHYDFAKLISRSVYEHNFDGVIKEDSAKAHVTELKAYLKTLQGISLSAFNQWPEAHQKSFLINALHAFQLDYYIAKNFSKLDQAHMRVPKTVLLLGKDYSFESFIKEEILKRFSSREMILSLHCFSEDCPEYRNKIWNYKNLEARLHVSANRYMRHPEKIKFDFAKKKVVLPAYLKKYEKYFPKTNHEWAVYLIGFYPQKLKEAALLKGPGIRIGFK